MKSHNYLVTLVVFGLTVAVSAPAEAADVRFSDQYEVGGTDNDKKIRRAIRELRQGGGRHLVAWISLDPKILELVLDPSLISEGDLKAQEQLVFETFDKLTEELVSRGNLILPAEGLYVRGASTLVKMDEIAFRALLKIYVVSDLLIYLDDSKKR